MQQKMFKEKKHQNNNSMRKSEKWFDSVSIFYCGAGSPVHHLPAPGGRLHPLLPLRLYRHHGPGPDFGPPCGRRGHGSEGTCEGWLQGEVISRPIKVFTVAVFNPMRLTLNPIGLQFKEEQKLSEGDDFYNSAPRDNDRVHVLVYVVPADTSEPMNKRVLEKIKAVREKAKDLGEIPHKQHLSLSLKDPCKCQCFDFFSSTCRDSSGCHLHQGRPLLSWNQEGFKNCLPRQRAEKEGRSARS